MKYFVKLFVITFLIFGTTNSFAENNKIVYIDMNKILSTSKAGITAEEELTNEHKAKLAIFKKVEEEMKKEEIDLISKRNVMKREEFDKKIRLLQDKAQKYQSERKAWFDEISEKRNKARNEVLKHLDPILEEYFKTNKISLMLFKGSVAIGVNELDISDTIIKKLNEKLPSVKLN